MSASSFELKEKSFRDDQALIAAFNLVCEYIAENIAEDWLVTIEIEKGEASLSLTNPDGEDVEYEVDRGVSIQQTICDLSNNTPRNDEPQDNPPDYEPYK